MTFHDIYIGEVQKSPDEVPSSIGVPFPGDYALFSAAFDWLKKQGIEHREVQNCQHVARVPKAGVEKFFREFYETHHKDPLPHIGEEIQAGLVFLSKLDDSKEYSLVISES